MADTATSRWVALALCLAGALMIGISGFSSDSNHPTYLPPALQYLDRGFLQEDWWLNSARHYHLAFFAVAAGLASIGILESGLAALNVVTVATALYLCFLIMCELDVRRPLSALAIFIALFLMSRTFASVGASYLFSPSLQPSSVAAAATIAAILALLRQRLLCCGACLAVAGLFHVNFLVVNIPFFATAYLLTIAQVRPRLRSGVAQVLRGLLPLMGPSLLLLALFAPLLLAASAEALSPSEAAAADWIFFEFAVPFHYSPLTFVEKLFPFLCWQAIGLLWTGWAVKDPARRRVAWAVQVSLFLMIWAATALTTFIFVPAVSRLFFWRLAPFAVLFSVLLVVVGALRAMHEADEARPERKDWITLLLSFLLLPTLLIPATDLAGQMVDTRGLWPAAGVLGILFLLVAISWFRAMRRAFSRWFEAPAVVTLLLVAFATQPSDGKRSRYSLLVESPSMAEERALYAFVRGSTPKDALFLTPPELHYFRLEGQRAIVADLKAMPINRSGLIEWYRRLARVSGNRRPKTYHDVIVGFRALDPERAERLRREFQLTHIVTQSDRAFAAHGWTEIFRNRRYRVLAYQSI